ncbi:MAG: mitochondrial ribosomal small subunit component [Chaenotheca gracillima]|nr:MAG: mitochondrial ribosomal small subunit component [Chaenotheca gracillima]
MDEDNVELPLEEKIHLEHLRDTFYKWHGKDADPKNVLLNASSLAGEWLTFCIQIKKRRTINPVLYLDEHDYLFPQWESKRVSGSSMGFTSYFWKDLKSVHEEAMVDDLWQSLEAGVERLPGSLYTQVNLVLDKIRIRFDFLERQTDKMCRMEEVERKYRQGTKVINV